MPGHREHDRIGFITAPVVGVSVAALAYPATDQYLLAGGIAALAHVVGTYWLSPDLDLRSAIAGRWGPFAFIWQPYERIVPHRSWLSHSGASGAIKVLYLCLCLLPLGLIWPPLLLGCARLVSEYPWACGLLLLGITTADLAHVAADKVVSDYKRMTRPQRASPKTFRPSRKRR